MVGSPIYLLITDKMSISTFCAKDYYNKDLYVSLISKCCRYHHPTIGYTCWKLFEFIYYYAHYNQFQWRVCIDQASTEDPIVSIFPIKSALTLRFSDPLNAF